MRVIVFGIGRYFKHRKNELSAFTEVEIDAFSDNNSAFWNAEIDGIRVIPPDLITEQKYDFILIMSTYVCEIKERLSALGIKDDRIKLWSRFKAELLSGEIDIYDAGLSDEGKTKVLIISLPLGYAGAPLAAVYAAAAVMDRGYSVVLAAPAGDEDFVNETVKKGITVAICPALPYIFDDEIEWMKNFDIVIVSTFLMMQSAYGIRSMRPVLWWLHEAKMYYENAECMLAELGNMREQGKPETYAVSRIALDNFNDAMPYAVEKVLQYGIPDMHSDKLMSGIAGRKTVFAIIGSICYRKAQDVFIEAVRRLDPDAIENVEFWIIGYCGDDIYCDNIAGEVAKLNSVRMMGTLTREEIYSIFPQIDVVVCTSREDPLPIVMTEGMMFEKVCITTDTTGTADYIEDGKNGFVIPSEDADALREKMELVLNNKDQLAKIGQNARKTYEKYFTMEVFGENLEKALLETKQQWNLAKEEE